jgi:hypothetical protein
MADRMAQSVALQPDVINTVADYGDERVNQEQMTDDRCRARGHCKRDMVS